MRRCFLICCVLICLGAVDYAAGSEEKITFGDDPFVNDKPTPPKPPTPAEIQARLHKQKLESIRDIVEDVEANDFIPRTEEEAKAIQKAERERRAKRQKIIQTMEGLGPYLVEITREKIKKEQRQTVVIYFLEMAERKDITDNDVDYFVGKAREALEAAPVKRSDFQAALIYGVTRLLEKHPTEAGKDFLLKLKAGAKQGSK